MDRLALANGIIEFISSDDYIDWDEESTSFEEMVANYCGLEGDTKEAFLVVHQSHNDSED